MPRFLIKRNFGEIDDAAMAEVGAASHRVIAEKTPDIVWEVSHVVAGPTGEILTFCIYSAPNEDRIREHASLLGRHRIDDIYEIGGDVSPADFPI
jgi:Protein of unknown function (DUF4242)